MAQKVRWGVIGAGGIADRRTIPGMMLCDNAELVAVMEINMELAEKCRAKWGCKRAYDSEAALLADPKNLLLTLELSETNNKGESVTNTYCFYSLYSEGSSRKVYLTVNGEGGFYVLRERVEKFVSDCHLFFDNQVIEYDSRH